jgi:glutamine amidotransferase
MAAYAGRPSAPADLLFGGTHSLQEQSWAPRELLSGHVNVDGFALAWFEAASPHPRRLARSTPPWHDPDVEGLLQGPRSAVIAAGLRNTTPGLPVDFSGIAPLVLGPWAFMLNGYVPDFRRDHMRALRAPLSDARYAQLTGVSDTETLFLRVLQYMDDGADPAGALRAVVQAVRDRLTTGLSAPLAMVLSHAQGHWVLNTNAGRGPCNSLYVAEGSETLPGGVVVASECLDSGPVWQPLPLHEVAEIAARP